MLANIRSHGAQLDEGTLRGEIGEIRNEQLLTGKHSKLLDFFLPELERKLSRAYNGDAKIFRRPERRVKAKGET